MVRALFRAYVSRDADLFADWDRLAANLQANLDLLDSERDARTPQPRFGLLRRGRWPIL